MKPIPLYFIAGFLGAGKTTVLNSLLASLDGRRAGLIINEFGAVGIDASRVKNNSRDIFELNNGQIFCACLAAPLASSLIQLAEKGPDLILAECSGLSRPSTLQDMIAGIAKTSAGKIDLAGLITVVDGPRYPVLSKTVQAVREQVACAGAVILNKTDLISSAEVSAVEILLREINPKVSILPAVHGRISISEIESVLPLSSPVAGPVQEYMGWGDAGRPQSYYLHSLNPVSKDSRYGLDRFLQKAAEKAFRIKGALPVKEGGHFFVDCVGENLVCELKTEEAPVQGLVIIVPGNEVWAEYFSLLWNDQMRTEVLLR